METDQVMTTQEQRMIHLDCEAKEIANAKAKAENEVSLHSQRLQNARVKLEIIAMMHEKLSAMPKIDSNEWLFGEMMKLHKEMELHS